MDERVKELTKDILEDVQHVASAVGGRAKREAESAATASAPGGGMMIAGVVVAAVGGALLLLAPAVPRRNRALRRRMMATSTLYLLGGGAAATLGAKAIQNVLRSKSQRAKRDLERTAAAVKEGIDEEREATMS